MPVDTTAADGLLIAAVLAGEGEAFAPLVRRYQAALWRAALSRLGRPAWAEEAVQETFLAAHRWLASYDSRYSFRTWLWTILLNQCTRLAQRERRQPAVEIPPADWEPTCPAASPLEQLLARESSQRLHALLSKLPEPQADALRLRFFGELTFPEIAVAMQISEPGAKHRVKAGLLKLAEWLTANESERAGHSPAPREVGI